MYCLYRHFNSENELLYVGISNSSLRRTAEHSKQSNWFKEISKITLEHFLTKEEVLFAEEKAIVKENPKFNIRCKLRNDFIPSEKELAAEFYPTPITAYYIGLNKNALEQKRCRKIGPNYHQFGKSIYYTKHDLDIWKAGIQNQ